MILIQDQRILRHLLIFAGRECARLHGAVRGVCLEALLTITITNY